MGRRQLKTLTDVSPCPEEISHIAWKLYPIFGNSSNLHQSDKLPVESAANPQQSYPHTKETPLRQQKFDPAARDSVHLAEIMHTSREVSLDSY
jgi:hypothetical protein